MRIIGGTHRGKKLHVPEDQHTRPTTDRIRENIFNILTHGFEVTFSGLRVLDLFAGTGALGIEALSRGAQSAIFVDQHGPAYALLKKNTAPFKNAVVLNQNALDLMIAPHQRFQLIFMDPPYDQHLVSKALDALIAQNYLNPDCLIVAEMGKKEEISLSSKFEINKEKIYGNTKILFIQLNQMNTD